MLIQIGAVECRFKKGPMVDRMAQRRGAACTCSACIAMPRTSTRVRSVRAVEPRTIGQYRPTTRYTYYVRPGFVLPRHRLAAARVSRGPLAGVAASSWASLSRPEHCKRATRVVVALAFVAWIRSVVVEREERGLQRT
jgi:hypothetical protein